MAATLSVGRLPRAADTCPGVSTPDWRVCVGHGPLGCVAVLRGVDRLRVLVAEPLSDRCPRGLRERLATHGRDLLAAGVGPTESADLLLRSADAARRTAPQAGLTVLDLLPGGYVQIACRYAPSAVHRGVDGPALLPALPGSGEASGRLAPGDLLLAYSGTFLEAVPPGVLADPAGGVAGAGAGGGAGVEVGARPTPCELWQSLASAATSDPLTPTAAASVPVGTPPGTPAGAALTAPDLAVITRVP